MIQIPFETVLAKLKEHGLSEEDINQKIKQKMDQLSGLISREGAAHILANELGIKLVEKVSGKVKIKDVLEGMRNVEVVGKVTAIFDVRQFQRKDGEASQVGSFILGDETGTIRVTCWGSQADTLASLEKDTIVKVLSAYVRMNQGRKELHLNDSSKLILNPPGETIGDVSFAAREFERKKIVELQQDIPNVELLATVVGIDALRFFEIDPITKKRARLQRDQYVVDGNVIEKPDYSYVMNLVLDDGSGNMRAVCFGDLVEKCLNVDKQQLIALREQPELQTLKDVLPGTIVKVKGRVKKNQLFDRLEFAVQDIDLKPDPYEEMEQLNKELETAQVANVEDL